MCVRVSVRESWKCVKREWSGSRDEVVVVVLELF